MVSDPSPGPNPVTVVVIDPTEKLPAIVQSLTAADQLPVVSFSGDVSEHDVSRIAALLREHAPCVLLYLFAPPIDQAWGRFVAVRRATNHLDIPAVLTVWNRTDLAGVLGLSAIVDPRREPGRSDLLYAIRHAVAQLRG